MAVWGCMRLSNLPVPEEGVFESVHTSQGKVEQPILGSLIPTLPVIPELAVGVRRGIRLGAHQIEAAVVEAIAILSGDGDTEVGLTGKVY